jgi:alpha-glucosidase
MKKYSLIASLLINLVLVIEIINIKQSAILDLLVTQYKIVFFGDSLTLGWKEHKLPKKDVIIAGNPGFNTSMFLGLLHSEIIKYKPDTCFIMGGINDIRDGIPLERTYKNYTAIIDTLKTFHIVPVVQSTLYTVKEKTSNVKVDSLNNFLEALCKSHGIRFINLNAKFSVNNHLNASLSRDGLMHLNTEGYRIWYKALQ